MKKLFWTLPLLASLLILSSCVNGFYEQELINTLNENLLATVWVKPNHKFLLRGEDRLQEFKSYESVAVIAQADSHLAIASTSSKAFIKVPAGFSSQTGILKSSESGQPYNIRLFRLIHPTKEWQKYFQYKGKLYCRSYTSDDCPCYPSDRFTEYIPLDDYSSKTASQVACYVTHTKTELWMNGELEFRLAFYDTKNNLSAIIYLKRKVDNYRHRIID